MARLQNTGPNLKTDCEPLARRLGSQTPRVNEPTSGTEINIPRHFYYIYLSFSINYSAGIILLKKSGRPLRMGN